MTLLFSSGSGPRLSLDSGYQPVLAFPVLSWLSAGLLLSGCAWIPADSKCDLDGDGLQALSCEGGTDCDDQDRNAGTVEKDIPYDGIDQDCDGADLADVDEDGYDSVKAGGDDCFDDESLIHPGAQDVPNDGIDQNCDGVDASE